MCYNPITIKTPEGYKKVPCGHCLECLRKYQNEWSNRMYEELKAHNGKAVFFTLTYNEESVPKNYLVDGAIYRSYSDYAYDNCYIGYDPHSHTWKPKSLVPGERIKEGVPANKVLTDAGIYDGIELDFNIKRNNHEKFIENVQRIYGDYLRLVSSTLPLSVSDGNLGVDLEDLDVWFENYEGDMFTYSDVSDTTDDFSSVLSDDDYLSRDSDCSDCDFCSECIAADSTTGEFSETGCVVPIRQDLCSPNLTPRPRPIMSFNSVRKEDVQKWLKRGLRKVQRNFHHGFKYFVTSEYGPRTLRPHYHGILFGVTQQEAQCMFSDWNRHFGFSKVENVDITKGGPSYCAKYCSKGMYEHPLCAKDFFYMHKDGRFNEFHSKHYDRCIEIFGIDEPIVDPTFHLISQGMGLEYVTKNQDRFLSDFTDINFQRTEATPSVEVVREIAPWDSGFTSCTAPVDKAGFKQTKITYKDIKDYDKNMEDKMEELVREFKYQRPNAKGDIVTYAMPQYYRAKILSDGLRASLATYVQQVNDDVFREKFRQVAAQFPGREDAEIVRIIEAQDVADQEQRKQRAKQSFSKQFNKSKL